MTLDDQQAIAIIKHRPNGDAIDIKRSKHEVLKAHVTGIGDDKLIEVIQGFERKQYGDTRKKMKMSNKDIIYRVMQPRNKIYTAKGGVETYTMKDIKQVEDFKIFMSDIRGTQSLKDYIKQNIQPMYDYDSEGLIWLDLNSYGLPYPCFKSIMQIYDYELNGRKPEYVAFELSKKEIAQLAVMAAGTDNELLKGSLIEPPKSTNQKKKTNKVFRIVCDKYDRIIFKDNSAEPIIISQIDNPFSFMGVPGLIVSNIVGAGSDYEDICYDSPLSPALDVLTQAMFGRSLSNISFARTAYPKEWMQRQTCPTCSGTKLLNGGTCPECKGTGALPAQLHSDVLIIDYRNDQNKSIPTPPMGVVPADVESLIAMQDRADYWEDTFNYTIWGVTKVQPSTSPSHSTKPAGKGGNVSNTAYEAQLNDQPKNDKLVDFSNWYAEILKWYADGCGKYLYEDSYIDSGIMGGTRFMIESADATFDRLVKARTGGATKSELDSLTLEYLENKYQNNPIAYRKYYILFIAEPFYHDATADVLLWDIPTINKMEKIFFDEWSATLDDEYFAMTPDDGLEEKVKNDLREYVMGRMQDDAADDILLFTNTGQLLNIGDEAKVKDDRIKSPSHFGQTYKVSTVIGSKVSLTNNDGSVMIGGYTLTDLMKVNN